MQSEITPGSDSVAMAAEDSVAPSAVVPATDGSTEPSDGGEEGQALVRSVARRRTRKLRLDAVDRALSPLRRHVAYALTAPGEVRYLEVLAGRWFAQVLALPLPEPVSDMVLEARALLEAFDARDVSERLEPLAAVAALLVRVDAVLGLPLDRTAVRRARNTVFPRKQVPERGPDRTAQDKPAAASSKRRGGRKGSRRDGGPVDKASLGGLGPSSAGSVSPSDDAALDALLSTGGEPLTPVGTTSSDGPWRLGEGPTGEPLSRRGLPESWCTVAMAEGAETYADLLLTPPSSYDVVRPVLGAGLTLPEGRVAVGGRVKVRLTRLFPGGERRSEAIIRGAGPAWVRWSGALHAPELAHLLPPVRAVFVGQHAAQDEAAMAVIDDVELAFSEDRRSALLPRYRQDEASDRVLRAVHRRLLSDTDALRDPLPAELVASRDLMDLGAALSAVHSAASKRDVARRRMAFEEALLAQLGLSLCSRDAVVARGASHPVSHEMVARLTGHRDITLDDQHQRALEDVKRDLLSTRAMRRVLIGRPGDDRAAVALLSAVMVSAGKGQVVWLLPDTAAAEASFCMMEPLLRGLGLVARLVEGEPSRGQRDAVRRGEVHVLFGTGDLAGGEFEFKRLGLVLSEEAVAGGTDLESFFPKGGPDARGVRPDVLVLPVFAAGAGHLLGVYADYDVTRVSHAERWPRLRVSLVPASEREQAYTDVSERVKLGRQALIAVPMGHGGDLLSPDDAVQMRTWVQGALDGAEVQLFHGALSREERNRRYDDFLHHRFDVLLSTHASEVGALPPAATELIVEQADRMPKHRLARLLYRLLEADDARILLVHGDSPDEGGMAVLRAIARGRFIDAFTAEVPLREEPRLRWIDPTRDVAELLAAREQGRALAAGDPQLRRGASPEVARALRARWSDLFDGECPVEPPQGSGRRRRRRRRRR